MKHFYAEIRFNGKKRVSRTGKKTECIEVILQGKTAGIIAKIEHCNGVDTLVLERTRGAIDYDNGKLSTFYPKAIATIKSKT